MAHAYVVAGECETGIGQALAFAKEALGLSESDPDAVVLRHGLFSVEDARKLLDIAMASPVGEHKAVIVSVERLFHEAQNALLKLFEEPPPDVTLILVVPSEGLLLPTLRSRLAPLPSPGRETGELSELGIAFLSASGAEREKMVAKLVDLSRSDKDEDKQAARSRAVRLAEDLMRASAIARKGKPEDRELRLFADDLLHLLPLLHTRSAPLKLIFEHLLIVIPKGLGKAIV